MRSLAVLLSCMAMLSSALPQTFTDVTASAHPTLGEGSTRGISWVDFNNDGFLDVFVPTAGSSPNKLYRNNSNGTFTEVAALVGLADLTNTITCSWGDFDNDGDMDLVTTATGAPTILWRNNLMPGGTDSTFSNVAAQAGISMTGAQMPAWADYNLDGYLDFYSPVSNSAASPDALYRNNGGSTFTNVADSAGVNHQVSGVLEQSVHWCDFNKDGYPDLFIGNIQTNGPSYLHRNNGNGTFTEIAATLGMNGAARGAQWIDYNNDGLWDLSLTPVAGATLFPVKLFRNNGNGTFTDVAASAGLTETFVGWGVTWADYNNDGYEDLFVLASGSSSSCALFRNNGNGTFSNVTAAAGLSGLVMLGAAWGDFDNDGRMDLYTAGSASNGNKLFKNNDNSGNNWLTLRLDAFINTNRAAIGARIVLYAGNLKMMREVNTGIGYRSQNMPFVHFGLGLNTQADSIVVHWPTAVADPFLRRTRLDNVAANQLLTINQIPINSVEMKEPMDDFRLGQNYPNPFNPETTIPFTLSAPSFVTLQVFDVLGREAATLVRESLDAGNYTVTFNAAGLPSGVYVYRLTSSTSSASQRFVILR